MSTEQPDVVYEVAEGVAWLTIDRQPKRNALRARTLEELDAGLRRAAADDSVRVVCVTGAGDKAFCAGADLGTAAEGDRSGALGFRRYAALLEQMAGYDKPLVARVAGHCVGGGMGLMLACDLVYAADDVSIGTPEVNVGLFPMMVAALLPREGSRKKVLEMVFTGKLMTASAAERAGLITRAHPREDLDKAVDRVLKLVVSRAPLALTLGRRAWAATEELGLHAALDHLCGELEKLINTEDAAEGLRAFVEKRKPQWQGK